MAPIASATLTTSNGAWAHPTTTPTQEAGSVHPPVRSICCIGAGYVGGPTCSMIAARCPHIEVTIVDVNPVRIAAWNSEPDPETGDLTGLPVYEPGLSQIVKECRGRNLFFSTDIDEAIRRADLVFVSVNTPTKKTGVGAGYAADLHYVESSTRRIASVATSSKIIVEKSTVPCRTASSMRVILESNSRPGIQFDILSNPEFLAEGTAIRDLQDPDRVLIGSLDTESGRSAADRLSEVYENWVNPDRIYTTGLWSSELSKLAANALLAQRISSINSLAAICESTGANIDEVAHACGLDQRIGSQFLKASVGFGGSCFQKDILNLVYLSESLGLPQVASYWKSVIEMNEFSKSRFAQKVVSTLFNTITGKKVAVLGFSFKKNTGDTRESPAITICRYFKQENAHIDIYDPKVPTSQIYHDLQEPIPSGGVVDIKSIDPSAASVKVSQDAYTACQDSEAIVLLSPWDEFLSLDWNRIYQGMKKPAFIFDGRGMLEVEKLKKIGFKVHTVGKGPEKMDAWL
ncbi:unnamed protein product [Sympodiomycopsis kandeliae]